MLFRITVGPVYRPNCPHKPGPPRPPIGTANKEVYRSPTNKVSPSTRFFVILPENPGRAGKRNSSFTERKPRRLGTRFNSDTPAELRLSGKLGLALPGRSTPWLTTW